MKETVSREKPLWVQIEISEATGREKVRCPICHTAVKKHDRYCSYCGQRITYHKEEWEDEHDSRRNI